MKSLLLTYSFAGGAGGAAELLHRGLVQQGRDAHALIATGDSGDSLPNVHQFSGWPQPFETLRRKAERLPLRFYDDERFFATQSIPNGVSRQVNDINPDVVNLHWVCNGFVAIDALRRLNRPIVWTAHDTWPFTGGCFYNKDCNRFEDGCGRCLALNSNNPQDLSWRVMQRKHDAWRGLDITLVTPTTWLADLARRSSLFRNRDVQVIPYGLDMQELLPADKQLARAALDLSQDVLLITFGAWHNERRKGFHLLQAALQMLSERGWGGRVMLAVAGFAGEDGEVASGVAVRFVGRLKTKRQMAQFYSASDVHVLPSLYENFGTMCGEAMACGTPVVTFRSTGPADVVDHMVTGYHAEPFEPASLADGIEWLLQDEARRREQGAAAQQKVQREYTLARQADRYSALYQSVHERAVTA